MTEGRRHGYYVEGVCFETNIAQARGRARHLANTYGRDVSITLVNGGPDKTVAVYSSGGEVRNTTPGGSDGSAPVT